MLPPTQQERSGGAASLSLCIHTSAASCDHPGHCL